DSRRSFESNMTSAFQLFFTGCPICTPVHSINPITQLVLTLTKCCVSRYRSIISVMNYSPPFGLPVHLWNKFLYHQLSVRPLVFVIQIHIQPKLLQSR